LPILRRTVKDEFKNVGKPPGRRPPNRCYKNPNVETSRPHPYEVEFNTFSAFLASETRRISRPFFEDGLVAL